MPNRVGSPRIRPEMLAGPTGIGVTHGCEWRTASLGAGRLQASEHLQWLHGDCDDVAPSSSTRSVHESRRQVSASIACARTSAGHEIAGQGSSIP